MPEFMDEQSRYEQGAIPRETDLILAVIALQEIRRQEDESTDMPV